MSRTRFWFLVGLWLVAALIAGCGGKSDCAGETAQVQNAQLEVGDAAPDFRLPDHRGGFVRLSDYQGQSNVVVVFFPAAFTPV